MLRVLCMLLWYAFFFGCFFGFLAIDSLYYGNSLLYKLKWLTQINMVLLTFYYGVCFTRTVVDYFEDRGRHRVDPSTPSYDSFSKKLHSLCDYLYTRLAFPLSQLVVIVFWTLYAIDRELIYPEHLEKFIPRWVNHLMHTAPAPYILIDTLLICHKYPPRMAGVRSVIVYGILYEISVIVWYWVENQWAYPILAVVDNFQRLLFFLGLQIFSVVLYLMGEVLNAIVWGPDRGWLFKKCSNHFRQPIQLDQL